MCILLAYNSTSLAQIEQVSIGASYSQQAFYKISTGEVTQVSNSAWDIAFSNDGVQDAGVFINESASFMASPVKLFVAETTDWDEAITNTAVFVEEAILYNAEANWTEGAFNSLRNTTDPFDYGWGIYNPMINSVEGNKIFVVQLRDQSFIKLQIQNLTDGIYSFRYADLDGLNETNASVSKNETDNLLYFSFDSGAEVEMPTDYDLVFQRYASPLDDGYGNILEYTVSGVLLAPNTTAVAATGVDPTTVSESDYADQYSSLPTTIGHDWKFFDFDLGWIVNESQANFVRTAEGEIYKIVFYDFEGSSTGITTLEKTLIGTVTNINNLELLNIQAYPNPTSGNITLNGINDNYQISLFDLSGNLLLSNSISNNQIIDLNHLSAGAYTLVLQSDENYGVQKLLIKK